MLPLACVQLFKTKTWLVVFRPDMFALFLLFFVWHRKDYKTQIRGERARKILPKTNCTVNVLLKSFLKAPKPQLLPFWAHAIVFFFLVYVETKDTSSFTSSKATVTKIHTTSFAISTPIWPLTLRQHCQFYKICPASASTAPACNTPGPFASCTWWVWQFSSFSFHICLRLHKPGTLQVSPRAKHQVDVGVAVISTAPVAGVAVGVAKACYCHQLVQYSERSCHLQMYDMKMSDGCIPSFHPLINNQRMDMGEGEQ